MAIAIAIIGVVFAAVCVWLTVRIVNRRERWAKWTLAAALIAGCPLALIVRSAQAARQAQQQAERARAQQEQVLKSLKQSGIPIRTNVTPD